MVLEKTLESPLDCKEIQLVHSEGDQPWDFFGRNDAEASDIKGSSTPLTFNGLRGVTMKPGEVILSDPVAGLSI